MRAQATMRWHDRDVAGGQELKIDGDLREALEFVRGSTAAVPDGVAVLAAYLHLLAKSFGLSDSSELPQVEIPQPPPAARDFIAHYLGVSGAPLDPEQLRGRLYEVFVRLSDDEDARRTLNQNQPHSSVGVLMIAQVCWNLAHSPDRAKLPMVSGEPFVRGGQKLLADLKVPGENRDFASMRWTDRIKVGISGAGVGAAHRSSGGGLRKKAARLAVLAAADLVEHLPDAPELPACAFSLEDQRLIAIRWEAPDRPPLSAGGRSTASAGSRDQRRTDEERAERDSMAGHSLARLKLAPEFHGGESQLASLIDFCRGDEDRLLVTGQRYSGKSALLAELFVRARVPDAIFLGYFVPQNRRQDARSEAMLKHLIRQAHLLATGSELHVDSVNPGRLGELLRDCTAKAHEAGKKLVVIVDGVDEDLSSREGEQSMISLLQEVAAPGLALVVSSFEEHVPEEASDWPRQYVPRSEFVAENLRQMEGELESMFERPLAREILQFLAFSGGSFQVEELAQLCGSSPRLIRRVLEESEERIFSAQRQGGREPAWSFAHPTYGDVARGLFREHDGAWSAGEMTAAGAISAEGATWLKLDSWADSFRNMGWPTTTPRYLLEQYPEALADTDRQDDLFRLLVEPPYVVACAGLGPVNRVSRVVARAVAFAQRRVVVDPSLPALGLLLKLQRLHELFDPTEEKLPPVLIEAVAAIRGSEEAKLLAEHMLASDLKYYRALRVDSTMDPLMFVGTGPVEVAKLVSSLVRADLGEMALHLVTESLTEPNPDRCMPSVLLGALKEAGDDDLLRQALRGWYEAIPACRYDPFGISLMAEHRDSAWAARGGRQIDAYLSEMARGLREIWGRTEGSPHSATGITCLNSASAWAVALTKAGRTSEGLELVRSACDYLQRALAEGDGLLVAESLRRSMWDVEWTDIGLADVTGLFMTTSRSLARSLAGEHQGCVDDLLAHPLFEQQSAPGKAWLLVEAGALDGALQVIDALPKAAAALPATGWVTEIDGESLARLWQAFLYGRIVELHPSSQEAWRALDRLRILAESASAGERRRLVGELVLALGVLQDDDGVDEWLLRLNRPDEVLEKLAVRAARRGDHERVERYGCRVSDDSPSVLAMVALSEVRQGRPQAAERTLVRALRAASMFLPDYLIDAVLDEAENLPRRPTQPMSLSLRQRSRRAALFSHPELHHDELGALVEDQLQRLWELMGYPSDGPIVDDRRASPDGEELLRLAMGLRETALTLERADLDETAWICGAAALLGVRTVVSLSSPLGLQAGRSLYELLLADCWTSREPDESDRDMFRDAMAEASERLRDRSLSGEEIGNACRLAITVAAYFDDARVRGFVSECVDALIQQAADPCSEWDPRGDFGRDRAIFRCIWSYGLLGEPASAEPLFGYFADGESVAAAHDRTAQSYALVGDGESAIRHAALSLGQVFDGQLWDDRHEMLRTIDPMLVIELAEWERALNEAAKVNG